MAKLKKEKARKRPTGKNICRWIEKMCVVPEGRFVGKPLKLQKWQRDVICDIYDNESGTRRAILSFGRKNGKTCLAACLLLVHLVGPGAQFRPNAQMYSTAQSRDQAALLFALASKMVRMNPDLAGAIRIRENAKELICPALGTVYRALSAETKTSFGLSPAFICHDELAQVKGPRSPLYEALETATGGQEAPLSIVISTQAPTDADLMSILIDDAKAKRDPHVKLALWEAPVEDDPFDIATIKKANPALGTFLNEREVMAMADDAKRMPAREAEFRNLILNQRVVSSTPFVTPAVWKANAAPIDDLRLEEVPCYAGLDLSEVSDLTALVIIGQIDKKWHVKPTFWLPGEGLIEKSIGDRVPYDMWARQGFLRTTPGHSISYEFVANYLVDEFSFYNIKKLAFDRWNFKHLRPWLLQAGFSDMFVTDHFVEFGQGMQSMSPALRDLEQILLEKEVCHGDHPVLSMCSQNCIVTTDDAGNRKLSKKKSVGRIDGMVALAMAFGVAPQTQNVDVEALIA